MAAPKCYQNHSQKNQWSDWTKKKTKLLFTTKVSSLRASPLPTMLFSYFLMGFKIDQVVLRSPFSIFIYFFNTSQFRLFNLYYLLDHFDYMKAFPNHVKLRTLSPLQCRKSLIWNQHQQCWSAYPNEFFAHTLPDITDFSPVFFISAGYQFH